MRKFLMTLLAAGAGASVWVVSGCGERRDAFEVPPPPEVLTEGTLTNGVITMAVDFTGKKPPARESRDFKWACDLSDKAGLQFDFYCSDISQFSSFSCYFKSGKGWYHGTFAPEEDGVWARVRVRKAACGTEGEVAGWQDIRQVRISAWRAGTGRAVCALANVAPAGGNPDVAIVYADSLMAAGGGNAYMTFAKNLEASFEAAGVRTVVMADRDLKAPPPASVRAVVLPYNPSVPAAALKTLRAFVRGGGKLMACYSTSDEVMKLAGVKRAGPWTRPEEAGLPAIGGFLRAGKGLEGQPEFVPQRSWVTARVAPLPGAETVAEWCAGDRKTLGIPALVRSSTGLYMAHVWLGGVSGEAAQLIRAVACELAPELRPRVEAHRAAGERAAREAEEWLRTCPSKAGEHRAFWCHSARGLGGDHTWETSVRLLKENGFNTLLPNLCWGGTAFYRSEVLPASADLETRGDALAECLAACRRHGVKCHVWKVCWNMGSYASKAFEARMAAEGRVQKSFKGKENTRWLCPSNPTNQTLEVEAMCELAGKGVDGVHFDYIRYPDGGMCFCDGCRGRFETFAGTALTNWPAQVRADEGLKRLWTEFRLSNITTVVRTVSERVRREHPGVAVSAAVFRNAQTDRETVAQDWAFWCREGYLDFVCNMDYIESPAMFASQVRQQKGLIGGAKIYPGIGLSCWTNDGRDAVRLAKQILECRKLGVDGYTVFNFDRRAERVLPLLRAGVTRED